jgi:hypothetical protein
MSHFVSVVEANSKLYSSKLKTLFRQLIRMQNPLVTVMSESDQTTATAAAITSLFYESKVAFPCLNCNFPKVFPWNQLVTLNVKQMFVGFRLLLLGAHMDSAINTASQFALSGKSVRGTFQE